MWNEPTKKQLEALPRFYETENIRMEDKIIYMHFFLGGCDWYAAEYQPEKRNFFGYAILNQDYQNAEWGYFNYDELRSVNIRGIEVDRDLHWEPKKVSQIENIMRAYRC